MKSDIIVLGINDAHDSSAAILKNGNILFAIAEERIQRIKSVGGYPKNAIEECLKQSNLTKSDIDYVALAGTRAVPTNLLGSISSFSIVDFLKIQEEVRSKQFNQNIKILLKDIFPNFKPKGNPHYSLAELPLVETRDLNEVDRKKYLKYRLDFIADDLNINSKKIYTIDHHKCHAYYAYYFSKFRNENIISLTLDNGGDGIYDSINLFDQNGNFSVIHSSHECIIAAIYSLVTLLLRMKPYEHEFKVMGLAPYAKDFYKSRCKKVFDEILSLDGFKFVKSKKLKDYYTYLSENLKYERFDTIAGSLQDWTEEILIKWISNVIKKTSISKIVYSGGVALNVKANQLISEIKELDEIFVPPGAGDESLSIGASWALLDIQNNENYYRKNIKPVTNAYLGSNISKSDFEIFFKHPLISKDYKIIEGNPNQLAAEALYNQEIVGLCRNRMEFGPRSLGNRSIIANPSSKETIIKINEAIKGRDFWMPFAPSINLGRENVYLTNQPNIDLSYMTSTVNSKKISEKHFVAAMHPYDKTLRVQIVKREINPDYFDLIENFYQISGIGGVLNTSLNIHGKPIVMNPMDIINEILSVDKINLNNLIIGNVFLKKI